MTDRPAVSVVVPFLGAEFELRRLIASLERLQLRGGDELIVADNRTTEPSPQRSGPVTVHPAGGVRSPGFARNRGAALASCPWIVFVDADTDPSANLLDAYFEPLPRPRTAVLGGGIKDVFPDGERTSAVARHAVERHQMDHRTTLERPAFRYAQTANCAFLRSAFAQAGGFDEAILAGEDADLCFRLRDAGWELESRPDALVEHRARTTLSASLGQLARHGSGAAWCNRRHPGSFPPPRPVEFAARLAGSGVRAVAAYARGEREQATAAALDLAEAAAFECGRLLPNRARR